MDTRSKIITAERAIEAVREGRRNGNRVTVVVGYFDVLLAGHVRELCRLGNGAEKNAILVLLTSPPEPILSAQARAEMAAALAMVDYVVIAENDGLKELLRAIGADATVQAEIPDADRTRHLIEHVHRRQRA